MSRWIPLPAAVLCLTVSLSANAQIVVSPVAPVAPAPAPVAAVVPAVPSGYVNVYGDFMRSLNGVGIDGPTGGSVEWGSFENKYVGAGTKIGLWGSGKGTTLPTQLFFGGGPTFHIPIGPHVIILPAVTLGYLLEDAPGGFGGTLAVYFSLGVAYRYRRFYFGLQAEQPIYLPLPNENSDFFPPLRTFGTLLGLYY